MQAQLILVVRDAAAGAAHGEARAQNHRVPELCHNGQRVLDAIRVVAAGRLDAELGHALVEQLPVLAALDGLKIAADHLDAVHVQDAGFGQLDRGVEAASARPRWAEARPGFSRAITRSMNSAVMGST